mgnify:CR=1 FL=1
MRTVDLPILGVVPRAMADDPAILALQRMAASVQIVNRIACWDHMAMFELRDLIVERAAENEALREDAERYRWLRSAKTGKPVVCTTADSAWNAWLNTVELDNAIDAARKA